VGLGLVALAQPDVRAREVDVGGAPDWFPRREVARVRSDRESSASDMVPDVTGHVFISYSRPDRP